MPQVTDDNTVIFTAEEYAELYENMAGAANFLEQAMEAIRRFLADPEDGDGELKDLIRQWDGDMAEAQADAPHQGELPHG